MVRLRKTTALATEDEKPKKTWLSNLVSLDGWRNSVTGMGIVGRDKGESTDFGSDGRLDRTTLDELGRTDGLARKIVHRVVDDAMRSGWMVTFKGDGDAEVTPEEAIEFNERLTKWYKQVNLKNRVSQHLKQARQYGGSLLSLGVMDGQDPSEPLNLDADNLEFTWLRAHDRHQVSVSSEINEDPRTPGFGLPEWYRLHSAQARTSAQEASNQVTMLDTQVHHSRVWRTDGVILSERVRLRNEGWGDSILQASYEPLRNWASVMKASRTVVQDWMQGVYKIQNLQGIILANGESAVQKRFHLMDQIKSVWNAVMVDTENESYERQTTSVAGLPDLLSWFGAHLSATADQPMTLLFGISPSGFGTGEAEGDNWDDTVRSFQTDFVEPLLEYVLGILFQTPDFEDFPENWSIQFTALQLTSPLEEADVRLKTSQADAADIMSGVLAADEVAMSRFGGSAYSTETNLDEQGREMDALAEEAGLGSTATEPLSGEQTISLLEVLARVKTGILPKASAVPVLSASLPHLRLEVLQAMVDPIEVTGPIDPKAAPPAQEVQSVVPSQSAPENSVTRMTPGAPVLPKPGAKDPKPDEDSDPEDEEEDPSK